MTLLNYIRVVNFWNKCLSILIIIFLTSCTGYRQSYKEYEKSNRQPKVVCNIPFINPNEFSYENSVTFGSIYLGEAGLTLDCNYNQFLNEARKIGCSKGADALLLQEVIPPDNFISTCYRGTVAFLECKKYGCKREIYSAEYKEAERLRQAENLKELQEKRQREAEAERIKIEKEENQKRAEKKKQPEKENIETPKREKGNESEKIVLLGTGTGFFINELGYLISNHHVIGNCKLVQAKYKGEIFDVELSSFDAVNDLAVGRIKQRNTEYIKLGNDISLAEDILVFGFPLTDKLGFSIKATKGIVSSLSGPSNNSAIIQFDASIQQGNSGGPIVNDKSELLGVTVATNSIADILEETGTIPQNINYGIKVQTLRSFLDANAIKYEISNQLQKLENKVIAKEVSNATMLVGCLNTKEVKNNYIKSGKHTGFVSKSDKF